MNILPRLQMAFDDQLWVLLERVARIPVLAVFPG
jgi:hypothetical protein